MKFGICSDASLAPLAKEAGFDYLEGYACGLLKPLQSMTAEVEDALAAVREAVLPTETLNGFFPGELKITGPDADPEANADCADTIFERAKLIGVKTIVFGSGGARRLPEGWSHSRGTAQIVEFLDRIAPSAQRCGIRLAIEPLRKAECNIVNTVGEAASIARAVNNPAVGVLVDCFHWTEDDDSAAGVVGNGDILLHTHIATYPKRQAPGVEKFDFTPFFDALKAAKYDLRVSIEGGLDRSPEGLKKAHDILRGYVPQ